MSLPKLTAFDCIWPFFSVESDVSAQDARDHQQSMTLPMCDVVVSCLRANALVNGARVNNRKSDFVCVWRNAFEETESTVCHRPSSSLPRKWTEKNQSRFTLENKSKRERERERNKEELSYKRREAFDRTTQNIEMEGAEERSCRGKRDLWAKSSCVHSMSTEPWDLISRTTSIPAPVAHLNTGTIFQG